MPTYEYACKECEERLEVVQRFTDDPLTECPSCKGPLRKVFGAVGIAFKGSGFYKTDSRGGSSKSSSTTAESGASKESSSSDSSTSSEKKVEKAAEKPAAAAATTGSAAAS